MKNLVTLKQAVDHLRLDGTASFPDAEMRIQQASMIVYDYLKIPVPEFTSPVQDSPIYDFWASTAIPFDIQAATLLIIGELFENREASIVEVLSDAVKSLLHRHRDPAMA